MRRLTFLSHFILCLGVGAASFFAYRLQVFATIWANDQSMATSAIALLFCITTCELGRQAWNADAWQRQNGNRPGAWERARSASASFGHLAERLAVMIGFVGTAIGLSLQAKALAGGSTSFTALATSLFTTACGGVAAALIALMTYSLECGIRRASR